MPLHAIGFWFDPRGDRPPVDPTRLVDPEWASADRDRVVSYLRRGLCDKVYMGFSHCRFQCGIPDSQMGAVEYNDGIWAWPEGLAHYVEMHLIALPDEFLTHVRVNDYEIPHGSRGSRFLSDVAANSFFKWETWARSRNALVDHRA